MQATTCISEPGEQVEQLWHRCSVFTCHLSVAPHRIGAVKALNDL